MEYQTPLAISPHSGHPSTKLQVPALALAIATAEKKEQGKLKAKAKIASATKKAREQQIKQQAREWLQKDHGHKESRIGED